MITFGSLWRMDKREKRIKKKRKERNLQAGKEKNEHVARGLATSLRPIISL